MGNRRKSLWDERAYFEQFSGEQESENICPWCGRIIPEGYGHLQGREVSTGYRLPCDELKLPSGWNNWSGFARWETRPFNPL